MAAGYGAPRARSRLFVAVRLPPRVRESLARATRTLRTLEGVRPVRVEQLHLTVRFIGEMERSHEASLARELAAGTADLTRFALRLHSAGVFPSLRRAKVIWLGVDEASGLAALHRSVEDAVVRAGVAPERRPFRPHMTVGRIRGTPPPVGLAEEITRVRFETTVQVDRVSLMRSELLPRGARHTEVDSWSLAESGS
ncbi:RNA 2',3'-cyclic phosphodiesterase [Candidatus Palauibacter sp.]|uniref:RNA 2',3'-cyclic phosphodiesterase n=1 Tax=Candidatus Palauibacter sp. TaxID=3101350 RepID=UPI003AF20FA8